MTSQSSIDRSRSDRKMLTFRGGGWILLVAAFVTVAIALLIVLQARSGQQRHPMIMNSVDLVTAIVPAETIIDASDPNVLRPLDFPALIEGSDVQQVNEEQRGKYLVSDDRVIGVVINGEARAYPIRMLDWHEVVNERIAEQDIVVTYNGLCDSAVVFARPVDENGDTLLFAASGKVRNSNLLLIDRPADDPQASVSNATSYKPSLWSQLEMRAIAGPAAQDGRTLEVVAAAVMPWSDWLAQHPDTLVLAPNPDPARTRQYKRRTYGQYFDSEVLHFPVNPLPPDKTPKRRLKTNIIAVPDDAGIWHVFAVDELMKRASPAATWSPSFQYQQQRVDIHVRERPLCAWATTADGELMPSVSAFWFAWYAAQGGSTIE
ncbi:MAG: DUF3179 domain-containing (seleno)protein [Phycisphaerales bacterium]